MKHAVGALVLWASAGLLGAQAVSVSLLELGAPSYAARWEQPLGAGWALEAQARWQPAVVSAASGAAALRWYPPAAGGVWAEAGGGAGTFVGGFRDDVGWTYRPTGWRAWSQGAVGWRIALDALGGLFVEPGTVAELELVSAGLGATDGSREARAPVAVPARYLFTLAAGWKF